VTAERRAVRSVEEQQARVSAAAVAPRPVRVAIAGTTISPGIFESVALLGREETLRRIDTALAG